MSRDKPVTNTKDESIKQELEKGIQKFEKSWNDVEESILNCRLLNRKMKIQKVRNWGSTGRWQDYQRW